MKAFIEKTLEDTRRDGSVRTCSAAFARFPTSEPQSQCAWIRGTHRGQYSAAGHGCRPDQAGHDRARPQTDERKLKTRMVLQVHDELLFEVPADETGEVEELVRAEMEGVVKLNVPLLADLGFGPNWRDL